MVSVVVPTTGRSPHLPEQLAALAAQDHAGAWEVLVAVNAPDADLEAVGRAGVRIVDASDRAGVSHARNVGAAAAEGDLVLFCDDDDVVTTGWVRAMTAAAATADVVSGPLDVDSLNAPEVRGWRARPPEDRLPVAADHLPYAVGCNFGVWTDVLDALGGFAEEYTAGGEDVDFSWRAQLAGYRVAFAPGAVVRYRYRPSLRATVKQVHRYGRMDARLFAGFRHLGMDGGPVVVRRGLREWAWLLTHLPDLARGAERRGRWVRRAAYRAGRLRGSVRHRVVFP